ncbi:DnaJ domain containing protein [Acanthamoeba castellanii str. Neff]|uniref:DnaJ domain containing protein n=1 Tax=Acanthamoeba castellanii (strain ATCC 30010 / Neff) TaxID=1257118 RepID=L8H8P4_ACACF|nr:DnaJ domain containing protein [Acanthamoeba castellanii str. Neff]ELR21545.1 DnaJ domain containing protein [Acanthamoeba castellanii str. Neff]
MKATRELCYYCFDTVVSHLEKQKCAPPEFQDASCPLCISWAKRVKKVDAQGKERNVFEARGSLITMTPVQLHSDQFLRTIRASAFEDPRQNPITAEDIPYLRCSASVILPKTYKTIQKLDDWEVGKHGIRILFKVGATQYSKVYPPETILARGWNKKEAIEEGIRKAGYTGDLTPQFMATVEIIRFETSSCIVSAKDYFKHVETKDKEGKLKELSARNNPDEDENENAKRQRTIRRRRHRYVTSLTKRLQDKRKPGAASTSSSPSSPSSSSSIGGWLFALAIIAMVAGVFILRGMEVTYDKDYDEFQTNYDILGIARGAPMADVKKAFRKLSLQYHPDKQSNCLDCADKFLQINSAYKQIGDYEKGLLRLVNTPGGPGPRSGPAR